MQKALPIAPKDLTKSERWAWQDYARYGLPVGLTDAQWADVDSDKSSSKYYSRSELAGIRETMRVAVLYALGYLYEHREEADHHALALTLRSLLFGIREGVV